MIRVKFWGATGSIPTPISQKYLKEKLIYAILQGGAKKAVSRLEAEEIYKNLPNYIRYSYLGNSACIEVQGLDDILILDAGSGIRQLGMDIIKRQDKRRRVNLFITHFHWDHLMGFPFFGPAFNPDFNIDFYTSHQNLEARLRDQQSPEHFPVTIDDMASKKTFSHFKTGETLKLKGVKVRSFPLKHPGGSFAYRFDFDNGKSLVYATDGEYPSREMASEKFQDYINFYKDADVLVFDAQYTFPELETTKMEWGHSSSNIGIELAVEANIKHLVLFHHEPSSHDVEIHKKLIDARSYRDIYCLNIGKKELPKVSIAIENGVIGLD